MGIQQDSISKITKVKRAGIVVQEVYLPYQAQSSEFNLHYHQKKKKKKNSE
jgi:hypothetical protein